MELHAANEATRLDAYLNSVTALGEWPKSLLIEQDAYLLPQTRYGVDAELTAAAGGVERRSTNGGVYTGDGLIVPSAIHRGGPYRYVPEAWGEPPPTPEHLGGKWLFAGALRSHFGHFVLESLGRLWGAEDQVGLNGIVYIAYRPSARPSTLDADSLRRFADRALEQSFVRDLLRLLGGDLPVAAITSPTRIDELVIPAQLIGNLSSGDFASGHPDFRGFVHRALHHFVPPVEAPRRRIYISRSELGTDCVAFLFEDRFEQALAEEGYEVIHPERMKIEDQIATYAQAEQIITPTGSAIHLAAFSMNGRQRVAVVDRSGGTARKFVRQLELFGAREVVSISRGESAISRLEEKPGRQRKSKPQAHLLDLDGVWADLLAAGFVSRPRSFGLLATDEVRGAIETLSARLGAELVVSRGTSESRGRAIEDDDEDGAAAVEDEAGAAREEKRRRRRERRRGGAEASTEAA